MKTQQTKAFEVGFEGVRYTRRPNRMWVVTERPWEKVVGPVSWKLEGIWAEEMEKGQTVEKKQPMIERVRIPRIESDDEWFERVYG